MSFVSFEPLAMFCRHLADPGQVDQIIARANGLRRLIVSDGADWREADNRRYCPRSGLEQRRGRAR